MDWLIRCSIVGAATSLVMLVLTRPTPPVRRGDGWQFVRPGAMSWLIVAVPAALMVLCGYIYLFVGSARPDAARQMTMCLLVTLSSGWAMLYLAYDLLASRLAWRGDELWTAGRFARPARYSLSQLTRISRVDLKDRWLLTFDDGGTVTVPFALRGANQLANEAKWHARLLTGDDFVPWLDWTALYHVARASWDPLRLADREGPWGFDNTAESVCRHLAYAIGLRLDRETETTVSQYLMWAEQQLRHAPDSHSLRRATETAAIVSRYATAIRGAMTS